jgi:glutathione synthase
MKINFLPEMEESDKDILMIEMKNNVDTYIIKPQKEGGGNNYSGKDILDVLQKEEILQTSIIMGKVSPPENDAYILRDGKLTKEKCVSEIGIYGIILSDDTTVHLNKTAGYLVRTKSANSLEGGVVMGFSAIDTPYLLEA